MPSQRRLVGRPRPASDRGIHPKRPHRFCERGIANAASGEQSVKVVTACKGCPAWERSGSKAQVPNRRAFERLRYWPKRLDVQESAQAVGSVGPGWWACLPRQTHAGANSAAAAFELPCYARESNGLVGAFMLFRTKKWRRSRLRSELQRELFLFRNISLYELRGIPTEYLAPYGAGFGSPESAAPDVVHRLQ